MLQGYSTEGIGVLISAFGVALIFIAAASRSKKKCNQRIMLSIAFVVLVGFAALRKVTIAYGGGDAWGYVREFQSSSVLGSGSAFAQLCDLSREPLYQLIMIVVRTFTENYHLYFVVTYGIIIWGILYFVSNHFRKGYPLWPLIVMFPAYIHCFNAMRSWMAIAVILVALTKYEKQGPFKYELYTTAATLIHYSAAVMLLLPLFAKFFRRCGGIKGKVTIVLLANGVLASASSILLFLLQNTKYVYYFSLDPLSFSTVVPLVSIVFLASTVFQSANSAKQVDRSTIQDYTSFGCCLVFAIVYLGGYRYLNYMMLPEAVLVAMTFHDMRICWRPDHIKRIGVSLVLIALVLLLAVQNTVSVIKLSSVFPYIIG
ncbi:EpsG family protein [Adlercreutzia sp. ZJ141]|uniref:EpsG family protein n=1 Tax=Adlercreutzia sp. ZJ141 TaxID=2709406 RepID=UPI0013E9FD9A|nr:EpsG family protein [Adlercreutzia sp. ZJ141]